MLFSTIYKIINSLKGNDTLRGDGNILLSIKFIISLLLIKRK